MAIGKWGVANATRVSIGSPGSPFDHPGPVIYDLAFIGGGLSCSFTLVYLLQRLSRIRIPTRRDPGSSRLRVAMLDRDGNFGSGFR
jgi:hypothetical protein